MSPKILTFLMVLISIVMYYGVIIPLQDGTPGMIWTPEYSIPALQSKNSSYAEAIAQANAIEAGAAKINSDYLAVSSSTIEKSLIMIPNSVDKLKLLNEVNAIANKEGVSISSVLVREESRFKSVNNVGAYSVSFSVKSRYPAFKKLMQAYERNLRFYVVNSITIQHPKESEGQQSTSNFDREALTMNVTFRVFYLTK